MKRQERQHLKQNDLATTAVKLTAAVAEHRSRVGLVAGIGALVLLVVAGVYFYRANRADKAGTMLASAMATAQSQIAPASSLPGATQSQGTFPTEKARAEAAIKAFSDIVAAYPNTQAGTIASYQLGSELLAAGKVVEAEQQFRKMMEAEGTSFYGTLAKMGLASAFTLAGKHEDAIKTYGELAAARDTVLPVDGVLMALAQANLKAGKAQDARAAFKRVVDEFPMSPYAADARQALGTN